MASEDKSNKEEDQKNTASQLEVHLAILLVESRESGKSLGLAHPRVRQDHEEATNDGKISEEEVEIEEQAIAESLGNNDTHETCDSIVRVLSGDDEDRASHHGNDVDDEENVGDTGRNCGMLDCVARCTLYWPIVLVPKLIGLLRGLCTYCFGNREGTEAGRSTA